MAQLKVSRKYEGGEDTEARGVKRKGEKRVGLPRATTEGGGLAQEEWQWGEFQANSMSAGRAWPTNTEEWSLAQLGGLKPCGIPKLE